LASSIERALYGDRGTHGVIEFSLVPGFILLRVAPWDEPTAWVKAGFANARFSSLDQYANKGEELDLPWDIIGFDSYDQPTGRWKFVLHCSSIEWSFESDWPVIERSPAEPKVAPDCGGIK
jgi:hypothetical protein